MKRFHVSKNLCDVSDISETVTVIYKDTRLIQNIVAGTYTLSFNTTANVAHSVSVGVGTTGYSKDIKYIYGVQNGYYSIDFTISDEDIDKNLYVRFVRFGTSTTVTYTVSSVMLNTGGTALPYEPYGNTWQTKSPPKYGTDTDVITELPQEIITDGQPIGANLFDVSSIGNPPFTNASGTPESAIGTLVDGVFTAKIGLYSRATYLNYSATLAQGTYTISFDAKETIVNSLVLRVRVSGENIISETINNIPSTYTRISRTFTLESESQIQIGIMPTGNAQQSTNLDLQFKDIMINTGSTTPPYQPYAPIIIKGNMVQSGTPSPSNPITPSETGDKTRNLFDRTSENVGYYVDSNGNLAGGTSAAGWTASDYIEIEENTQYTFNPNTTAGNSAKHCFYNAQKQPFASYIINSGQQTFTTPSGAKYVRFSYRDSSTDIMLNTGSTPLPYEPYGYKLDINSGSTTTPVYLGEVETTRQIKKLVLTGEETITSVTESTIESGSYCFAMLYSNIGMEDIINYDALMREIEYPYYICSHFIMKPAPQIYPNAYNDILSGQVGANTIKASGSASDRTFNRYIIFCLNGISTIADFKAYLQAQYAAGTPVTVWYILATPTTGIVNEPIRKIGNYSDTISVSNIPTTAGRQTFNINTTLKPSEVDLTYHGWHTVADAHEKSNNLFDANTIYSTYKQPDGTYQATRAVFYGLKVKPFSAKDIGKIFTFAMNISPVSDNVRICGNIGGTVIDGITTNMRSVMTFTVASIDDTLYLNYGSGGDIVTTLSNIMLNEGETVLPYEPYWK